MKARIKYVVIGVAVVAVVALWAWLLEWLSPGTPMQALLGSLILLTPATLGIVAVELSIVRRVGRGEPVWKWREPGPRKLPLWYRILSKLFG